MTPHARTVIAINPILNMLHLFYLLNFRLEFGLNMWYAMALVSPLSGRGLDSSTFQLNLRRS
jgi:hypothetical protein